jgi:hypothetical protein
MQERTRADRLSTKKLQHIITIIIIIIIIIIQDSTALSMKLKTEKNKPDEILTKTLAVLINN